ncbi:unnamed protein product, partial [Amoebophrya sp. A120]
SFPKEVNFKLSAFRLFLSIYSKPLVFRRATPVFVKNEVKVALLSWSFY